MPPVLPVGKFGPSNVTAKRNLESIPFLLSVIKYFVNNRTAPHRTHTHTHTHTHSYTLIHIPPTSPLPPPAPFPPDPLVPISNLHNHPTLLTLTLTHLVKSHPPLPSLITPPTLHPFHPSPLIHPFHPIPNHSCHAYHLSPLPSPSLITPPLSSSHPFLLLLFPPLHPSLPPLQTTPIFLPPPPPSSSSSPSLLLLLQNPQLPSLINKIKKTLNTRIPTKPNPTQPNKREEKRRKECDHFF